jgi:hypothetical protein
MNTRSALAITSAVLLSSFALASSAAAAGRAPSGQAHYTFTSDYHISNFVCDDGATTDLLVTRAGPYSSWNVDGIDQHYVMASVAGELTVTVPGQDPQTYDWDQSYGKKTGKAPGAITCSADFSHEHDGVTEEGPITIVLVPVW